MKRKVLVTGGLGYIGSHTVINLLKQTDVAYEVVIVDNLSNSNILTYDKIKKIQQGNLKLYVEDVLDKKAMQKIIISEDIDSIIHFAGYKAVGESVKEPLKYYRNNLDSTINLLELCQEHNINKFVFSSSATVYGLSDKVPLNEQMPISTINPYARTKSMIESVISDFSYANREMKAIALRYFNPLGAHFSGEIGENPNGIPNNLAPYITQVAVGKLEKLHIFGNDYPTPDGTCIRDYVHVMDLAEGHVKALNKLYSSEKIDFEVINLGSGKGFSVFDILFNFEKVIGKEIPYDIIDRREGDVAISIADINKAKKILGWEPTKTLKEMCEDSWNWQKRNPNGY